MMPTELCCDEGTSCFTALLHHNNNMIPDFGRIDAMFEEVLRHVKKTDENTEEIKKDLRIIRSRVEVMKSRSIPFKTM